MFSVTSGENLKVPAFYMAESNWKHSFHVEQRRYYKQITAYCRTISHGLISFVGYSFGKCQENSATHSAQIAGELEI